MANYTITWSCGHTSDRQLYGKEIKRTRFRAWATEHGICDACRSDGKLAACEAVEAEHTLPALSGSARQVAWARGIRSNLISAIAAWIEGTRKRVPDDKSEAFEAQAAAVMQAIYARRASRWWIEHRDVAPDKLANQVFREVRS